MNIFVKYYGKFGSTTTDIIYLNNGNKTFVKELKKILQEKYNINPSNQRLTVNLVEDCIVMLTNEFPLSFFYIKENSKIYLEFIQELNKHEEIFKKVLTSTKSKYLKSLGFFNHFNTNLAPIRESRNEQRYESVVKSKAIKESFANEDEEIDILFNVVKNNNINEVKEILENYDNINLDFVSKNGWAAIHLASYYGFTEVLVELILKKANANLKNRDGWTALHLACYKGKDEIVKILLNVPDIEVNDNVQYIGTPLHVACRKNNVKIVSLLLLKADPE